MTPQTIKAASTKVLLTAYKHKARCFHSERKAESIYREIESRLGSDALYGLRLATHHMQHGEGDAEFNEECDKLITTLP